jgi:iron-sulfur cluster repair protein YtfE (RIC family)
MNNTRRKVLAKIAEQLETLKEQLQLDVIDAEQEAFDNLPEPFQYGEKGERMEEVISNLEDAISSMEDAIDYISQAQE